MAGPQLPGFRKPKWMFKNGLYINILLLVAGIMMKYDTISK